MKARCFITGTDTGIGKTYVSASLLRAARARGLRTRGMKPVASGCIDTPDGLRSEDALALIEAMGTDAPAYAQVNPYALLEPLSPHIAARHAGVTIDPDLIRRAWTTLSNDAEFALVEGVGGWCVPITDEMLQSSLVRALDLPVVLVVGVKLGCINHALLSARAIAADGRRCAGWIANVVEPTLSAADEAIGTIAQHLGAPLGVIEPCGRASAALLDALLTRLEAAA